MLQEVSHHSKGSCKDCFMAPPENLWVFVQKQPLPVHQLFVPCEYVTLLTRPRTSAVLCRSTTKPQHDGKRVTCRRLEGEAELQSQTRALTPQLGGPPGAAFSTSRPWKPRRSLLCPRCAVPACSPSLQLSYRPRLRCRHTKPTVSILFRMILP